MMWLAAVWWVPAVLAGVAAIMTLFNLWTWPRGQGVATFEGRVSVLIPARNEEASIGACVDSVLGQTHPLHEVLVLDDGSTDATPALLAVRAARDPRLRVLAGSGLPDGWVGKPHACHQLARAASGELLVYIDADVVLDSDAIGRMVSLIRRYDAQVLTAVPGQDTGSFLERLILPLLHLTYTAWLPLALVHATHDPRFLAANGQILAVRREAYDRIGGFEAVRREVVDDMAFCTRAKQARQRVVFADGSRLARCRMYSSAAEVWSGFSKNLYEGLGESPLRLVGVGAVYGLAFVVPFVGLGLSAVWPALLWPMVAAVSLNVLLRVALWVRFRHPLIGVLLHPLAVVLLLAIAVNSWRWARRGQIEWAGRVYAARSARGS